MIEAIWQYIVVNIIQKPQYFIGLIVIIGYLLLKKPWHQIVAGFLKSVIGYLILVVGAKGLVTSFRPILLGLSDRFQLKASVIDPYFGQNAIQQALSDMKTSFSYVLWLLLIAFGINLLLVYFSKYTKMRAVFLTGHIQIQQATTAFFLVYYCFPSFMQWQYLIIMSILLGLYWSVGTNLTVDIAQDLTQGAGFCVAHQQMFGIKFFSILSDKLFGKKAKKLEDIELPKFLSMFNESIVVSGLLMLLFFGTILVVLGPEYLSVNQKQLGIQFTNGTDSFFFFALEFSLKFAVYLSILQLGVRTFVSELTYAFQGVSRKILPNSIIGIDCAAIFGFGSFNAVTIGFLFGSLGQFLAIAILILTKSPVLIIAGFIPMFFDNGVIGVFSNDKGGYKAAMLMPFISGLCQVLGSAGIIYFTGLGNYGGYLGMWDWAMVWPVFTVLMYYGGLVALVVIVVVLVLIPQIQYYRNKEHYFLIVNNYREYKKQKGGK